jgi:hypothetical protein
MMSCGMVQQYQQILWKQRRLDRSRALGRARARRCKSAFTTGPMTHLRAWHPRRT